MVWGPGLWDRAWDYQRLERLLHPDHPNTVRFLHRSPIPLPEINPYRAVLSLKMPTEKKIGVIAIFMTGFL